MSEAERQKPVKKKSPPQRKPAAGRNNTSAGKTKPVRRRKPKPIVAITIDPDDAQPQDASLTDKLKDEARTGIPGIGVSVAVHIVLLGIMALVVAGSRHLGNEDPAFEFGWISAAASSSSSNGFKPLDIPNTVSPNQPRTSDNGNDPPKTNNDPNPPTTRGPVRPADVKNILNGRDRDEDKRNKMLEKYGGGEDTERAVNIGLMWLKRQQRNAGNWSLHEGYPDAGYRTIRTDTGATALALLAFLGTGHTHRSGDHRDTVERGLKWLKGVQKTDGNFHDHVELGRQTAYYAHAQATIVLCEAYAMTGDENLRESAQAGITFLIDSQQPVNGGWKYFPQEKTTIADLSVTGWALMALHTARVAGFDVPVPTFELSARFLDSVQVQNGAKYKYEPSDPASRASAALSAEGLLCRQYLGWPNDDSTLMQGVDFISQEKFRPQWSGGRRNVYEWYYVGHVLHNMGGDVWKDWYQQVQKAIVPNQTTRGSNKGENDIRGSWHPTEPLGSPHEYADKAGRLYITAMCILILEMPYRHLPIYEE